MSAGVPNFQKLYEMGKLPKEQRGRIPLLAQLDSKEELIEKIKKEACESCHEKFFGEEKKKEEGVKIEVRCEEKDCDYVTMARNEGIAKNILRLHMRSHESKK